LIIISTFLFALLSFIPTAGAIQIGKDDSRLTYDSLGTKPTISGIKGTVITLNGTATPNTIIKIYWDTLTP